MEKETIWKDEKAISDKIKESEQVLPAANKALQFIKDEGISPTPEHLKGFITGGGDYIIGALGSIARKDIEKMNLKLDKLKQSFLQDATAINQKRASETHAELYRAMNTAKVKADDLEVSAGKAGLKKSFVESIEEQFTVVLNTQARKNMWEAIQNFVHAFNEMEDIAEKSGILSLQDTIDVNEAFILKMQKKGNYARAEPDPSFFLCFQGIGRLGSREIDKQK
ncbi:hypothetical protein [Draconibacterium sediminis]|uniref:Uncharacterized protein n=1 Tax=Draconibacterium sediminis TaxID=1544798 RepID=A0A0D8JBE8_9BACT|nr:hypothetical protein [Draconibacterium sediminis]KJF44064.1 hypothetical protein LH29_00550 [Draconibacterium sediminis]